VAKKNDKLPAATPPPGGAFDVPPPTSMHREEVVRDLGRLLSYFHLFALRQGIAHRIQVAFAGTDTRAQMAADAGPPEVRQQVDEALSRVVLEAKLLQDDLAEALRRALKSERGKPVEADAPDHKPPPKG